MTRAIITVVGKDTVGIIAKVCTYLADNSINIEGVTKENLDAINALISENVEFVDESTEEGNAVRRKKAGSHPSLRTRQS